MDETALTSDFTLRTECLLSRFPVYPSLRAADADAATSEEASKAKEAAVERLCALLVREGKAAALAGLLRDLRPLFASIPKARTAKIVRTISELATRAHSCARARAQPLDRVPPGALLIIPPAPAQPPHS